MIEVRNAERLDDGNIFCEINHPKYGWIPFTASPIDAEQYGREIFAVLQAEGVADDPKRRSETILMEVELKTRRQHELEELAELAAVREQNAMLKQVLVDKGLLTEDDLKGRSRPGQHAALTRVRCG